MRSSLSLPSSSYTLLFRQSLVILLEASLTHQAINIFRALGTEFASLADRRAVLVKQERQRHTDEGQEGGHRRGPVDAEALIHVPREQRKGRAENIAQDDIRRESGGCL